MGLKAKLDATLKIYVTSDLKSPLFLMKNIKGECLQHNRNGKAWFSLLLAENNFPYKIPDHKVVIQ